MREIKFRGKCKVSGEWKIGSLIVDHNRRWISVQDSKWNLGVFDNYEVIPETVGQYVKLKNCIGIYENDVISLFVTRNIKLNVVISFQDGMFGVTGIPEGYGYRAEFYSLKSLLGNSYGFEIIGNIYENPELLE